MITNIKDLLARVRKAKRPHRTIDHDVGFLCDGWTHVSLFGTNNWIKDHEGNTFPDSPGAEYTSYTESLDALAAFKERVLPGWRGDLDIAPFDPGDLCGCRLFGPGKSTNILGEGATPALAFLAAILSALIAKIEPTP